MKRPYRILSWIAGILIALILIAVILVKLFFPVEKARLLAIEKGSAALGRSIDIESVDVSFWGGLGVELQSVTIANAPDFGQEPLARVGEVDVKLSLLPLLKGEINIDRLIINDLRAEMIKRPDGTNNYTFAATDKKIPPHVRDKVTPEAQAVAATVSFDRLELHNGNIRYQDDSSGMVLDISTLSLSTSLSIPNAAVYHSRGHALAETLVVVLDTDTLPPLTVATRHDAEFDLSSNRLTLRESELTINGLTFTTHGSAEMGREDILAAFNFRSTRIAAKDVLNLLPPERLQALGEFTASGFFSVDADLTYDQSTPDTLRYTGSIELTDAAFSRADIPGELEIGNALIDFETNTLRLSLRQATFDKKPLRGQLTLTDFDNPSVNGDLAGNLDLTLIQPFLDDRTGKGLSGQLAFELRFAGALANYENLDLSGQLAIANGRYGSPLLPEPLDSFELDLFFDNSTTRINRLVARSPKAHLEVTGRITNLIPYVMADSATATRIAPRIDLKTSGQADLSLGNRYLASESHPVLTGNATWDMAVNGLITDLSSFDPRGTVVIRSATYTDELLPEPIERFDADLIVTRDTVTIRQLDVTFPSSDLSLTGKLAKPFPNLLPFEGIEHNPHRKPTLDFALTSERFNTDKLFPEAVPGAETTPPPTPTDRPAPTTPPVQQAVSPVILPDINGRGTLAVDSLVYSEINFTDITAKVRIQDRKIEVYDALASVYTGSVTGTTTIDLTDPAVPQYTGRFQAAQIQAGEFVRQFTPLSDQLTGKMDFAGDYRASGTEREDLKQSLVLNGDLSIRNGQFEASDNTFKLINSVANTLGENLTRTQNFKDLVTSITVEDGKVKANRLRTTFGAVGDLVLDGYYGFDGSLDYSGSILLSKAWSEKLLSKNNLLGDLADFLSGGSAERIKLPLAIGGTVDKPSVGVDLKSVGKDATGDLLKGLLKKQ